MTAPIRFEDVNEIFVIFKGTSYFDLLVVFDAIGLYLLGIAELRVVGDQDRQSARNADIHQRICSAILFYKLKKAPSVALGNKRVVDIIGTFLLFGSDFYRRWS
jgi:hypothetical protein